MNESPWMTHHNVRLIGTTSVDINNTLHNLPGILSIEQTGSDRWTIRYDVRAIQFATVATVLKPYLPVNWFWRWKTSWFSFADVNSRDSLLSKGGACCNKPPRNS